MSLSYYHISKDYIYSLVMKRGFTFVLVQSTLLFGINYWWLSQNFT